MNPWLYLLLAIAAEVTGTTFIKLSDGFRNPVPSALTFFFYAISLTFLILCMRRLDLSTAYAVWAGLGTALIAAIGILAFREPLTPMKAICIAAIILGVVGLHYGSTSP